MDAIQKLEYRGYTIEVGNDEFAANPRFEQDNMTHMVFFHRRLSLGDEHDYRSEDFAGWDAIEEQIRKDYDICILKTVYMYNHSGITISTSPFPCPWDSGVIGFVFITKEEVRNNWGVKRIGKNILQKTNDLLEAEIREHDQYLRGECYSFDILDKNGDSISPLHSSNGWMGNDQLDEDSEMFKEAREYIDTIVLRNYEGKESEKRETRVCSVCEASFECPESQNRPTLPSFEIEPEICRVCLYKNHEKNLLTSAS